MKHQYLVCRDLPLARITLPYIWHNVTRSAQADFVQSIAYITRNDTFTRNTHAGRPFDALSSDLQDLLYEDGDILKLDPSLELDSRCDLCKDSDIPGNHPDDPFNITCPRCWGSTRKVRTGFWDSREAANYRKIPWVRFYLG